MIIAVGEAHPRTIRQEAKQVTSMHLLRSMPEQHQSEAKHVSHQGHLSPTAMLQLKKSYTYTITYKRARTYT